MKRRKRTKAVPLAKGGKDSWENIKLAHCLCNSKKGAKVISGGQ